MPTHMLPPHHLFDLLPSLCACEDVERFFGQSWPDDCGESWHGDARERWRVYTNTRLVAEIRTRPSNIQEALDKGAHSQDKERSRESLEKNVPVRRVKVGLWNLHAAHSDVVLLSIRLRHDSLAGAADSLLAAVRNHEA